MDDIRAGPRIPGLDGSISGFDPTAGPLMARDFSLSSLFALLQRQKKLILATVFVVLTGTALVVFQLTPIYSASSLIIVDPRQQNILDPDTQIASPSENGRIESEVEIVRSQSVFQTVVSDGKLYLDPEFAPVPGLFQKVAAIFGFASPPLSDADQISRTSDKLRASTSISRVGVTYLIGITARSADAKKAASIANAIAAAYINAQIDAKVETTMRVQAVVTKRLDEASAALRQSEAGLDDFVTANIDRVSNASHRADLDDLRRQIEMSTADRLRYTQLADTSEGYLASGDWEHLVTNLGSEALKTLNEQRTDAARALNNAAAGTSAAIDLKAELSAAEQQVANAATSDIDKMRDLASKASQQEQTLRDQLRDRAVTSDLPKDLLVQLYELQQQADVSRTLYQGLLNRSRSVESGKDVQVADSRVVSPAIAPPQPSFPQKRLILALAGFASLVIGFGLALLRENYVGGFIDSDQLQQVLKISSIAALPKLIAPAVAGKERPDYADELIDRPLSAYSENMRHARLALELAEPGGEARDDDQLSPAQTILVTSALPGEGKTQTAISLARSLAIAGKKTLLIDCDLRRPSVHKALNQTAQRGILEFLSAAEGAKVAADVIQKDTKSDLNLVLGTQGGRAQTDALLGNAQLRALMSYARYYFEFIVVDSSPILPVADVRRLMRYASTVILVVQWASTSQRDVRSALGDLARINHNNVPIAAILNRIDAHAIGYGKRYAAYYAGAAET